MEAFEEQDFTAKKINLHLWKRIFAYTARNKRFLIGVVLVLLGVSAIDILYPLMSSFAIDRFILPKQTNGLTGFIVTYVLLVLLQGFFVFAFIMLCGKTEMEVAKDIREDTFKNLQRLSFSFYDKTPVGYLMARMVSDVTRLSELVAWSYTDVLWSVFYVLGSIISMFVLSPLLALIVLLVIPPLAVISSFLQKRILEHQRGARKQNSKITGAFNEGINGAVTTKTLVREDANTEEFHLLSAKMRSVSIKSALTSAAFFPVIISLGAIGTGLALTLGSDGLLRPETALIGGISAGTLVAFISYASQLFDPIQQLASILAELLGAQASAERVVSLMDAKHEVVDREDVILKYGDAEQPKTENFEPMHGDITFDHVSFSYNTGSGKRVLDDFSLDVKQGENIALVGETGAGKSTIVNLLCRFYEPTDGRILVDGRDYRDRSQYWLQSNLGYVLQTPFLFSGTIRDNIRFGVPDATDDAIRAAAELVDADRFIRSLDRGYDTEVGEGGALLSTGQKQLISFARVILKDPRIFVLDEATSSVDAETEVRIQNAITKVLSGRTSFIVAHRLSTIRSADRILVIHDGGIAESGTHDELMELRGRYYRLYTQQFLNESTMDSLR